MSILINKNTKVICQGMTGMQGTYHTKEAIKYGTNVVGGVTPFKGGVKHLDLPVFDTVDEAKKYTNCNASMIYVAAPFAFNAILEAIKSEIETIVCITEGIPIHDMLKIKEVLKTSKSKLIGPNCPGVTTVDECKMGIIPNSIYLKGEVGIVSRSGTLTYECIQQLTSLGIGQSTCVGIGGDPICGIELQDIVEMFLLDDNTSKVVVIGEIGGIQEQKVAQLLANSKTKKQIFAFVAGKSAPKETKMGHAGAIVKSAQHTAENKIKALKESGVVVSDSIIDIAKIISKQH